jgi:integration host factor subunit beta
MTNADLTEAVAGDAELAQGEAAIVVETIIDSMVEALKAGGKVQLRGFGSFRQRVRKPRQGRNPMTGEVVDVPQRRVPYFKPGKGLKELINS